MGLLTVILVLTFRVQRTEAIVPHSEQYRVPEVVLAATGGLNMGFGRGALLWLIGIPLPIILLLAIFMHH
jgi:hypothetical protein